MFDVIDWMWDVIGVVVLFASMVSMGFAAWLLFNVWLDHR